MSYEQYEALVATVIVLAIAVWLLCELAIFLWRKIK